jgi:tetracycline repressor-like protein
LAVHHRPGAEATTPISPSVAPKGHLHQIGTLEIGTLAVEASAQICAPISVLTSCAAADRIRRTGIVETSLADVMAAAGLTHGGFYKHFRNKEHLVHRIG